jgi:hypothetical protein
VSGERVSDGLLAELQRKIDDGTPRGLVWPMIADLLVMAAECASTPEEIEMTNQTLVAMIHNAEDSAVDQLEIQACLAQLQGLSVLQQAEEKKP